MNYVVNDHNIIEILLFTFFVSLFLVFISMKVSHHVGAIDYPDERKIHKKPIPRLGGMGIFGAFLFGYMMYGTLNTQMLSVLIGAFLIFFLGFLDDMKPIRARDKFIVQIIVALIIVFYGNLHIGEITVLGLTINFPIFVNRIISIFFILGTINAMNLIDGLDGLCGGISSIYFLTITIIAFVLNKMSGLDIILCLIMLGSTLGFLVFNFPPAKTFMGDCGSTFLGLMVGVIALLGFKTATITSLAIPIVILAIPIFDTLTSILRRVLLHKSIGEPDKKHLHHQLLKMKFSPRVTILIIYAIDIAFCAVSIFYALGNNKLAMIIYIIMMLVLLFIVAKTDILFEHKKSK